MHNTIYNSWRCGRCKGQSTGCCKPNIRFFWWVYLGSRENELTCYNWTLFSSSECICTHKMQNSIVFDVTKPPSPTLHPSMFPFGIIILLQNEDDVNQRHSCLPHECTREREWGNKQKYTSFILDGNCRNIVKSIEIGEELPRYARMQYQTMFPFHKIEKYIGCLVCHNLSDFWNRNSWINTRTWQMPEALLRSTALPQCNQALGLSRYQLYDDSMMEYFSTIGIKYQQWDENSRILYLQLNKNSYE